MVVGLMDGSVHMLGGSVTQQAFFNLICPKDGQVVGDW
jgi:hypothetical protein